MNDIWRDLLHLRADVTAAIGVVLAIGATIHILLRKREVASAVGWIGLVWFAPILGAISYVLFGVNRVRSRARQLRPTIKIPTAAAVAYLRGEAQGMNPLGLGIGHITARPLLTGTEVTIYQDGDAAYLPMLAAIEAAKSSVGLSSNIFRNDAWGGRFIVGLIDGKRRGVEVRVLIDGIGGGWLLSPTYRRLCGEGVRAARFMHSLLPWRMPFINLRNHKKVLVLDGMVAFTGGMNIADENVMAARPKMPVQDLHFRIDGPVVSQLAEAFVDDWAFVTGEDLEGAGWLPQVPPREGPSASIRFRARRGSREGRVRGAPGSGLRAESIDVMTPYFLPDERLITALSLAAMRGVTVNVVLPQKSNHMLVDWGTRGNIGPLLGDGVHIWRSPPPFHHTKIMVVDQEWCLIGSCNWDIRSFRLNFELRMEVYDRSLATALTSIMAGMPGARN